MLACLIPALVGLGGALNPQQPLLNRPWMDASLPVDNRTALLLAAMTTEEKVAQLGYGGCGDANDTVRADALSI